MRLDVLEPAQWADNPKGDDRHMKQFRIPAWFRDFVLVFLLFVSLTSLRKLHAAGQPIWGTVVEGAGAAALFCLLSPIWDNHRSSQENR